jgi:hypothetical protein
MRYLIKDYLLSLLEQQRSFIRYILTHRYEEKTLYYAATKLALAWCELKISFWSAFIGKMSEE